MKGSPLATRKRSREAMDGSGDGYDAPAGVRDGSSGNKKQKQGHTREDSDGDLAPLPFASVLQQNRLRAQPVMPARTLAASLGTREGGERAGGGSGVSVTDTREGAAAAAMRGGAAPPVHARACHGYSSPACVLGADAGAREGRTGRHGPVDSGMEGGYADVTGGGSSSPNGAVPHAGGGGGGGGGGSIQHPGSLASALGRQRGGGGGGGGGSTGKAAGGAMANGYDASTFPTLMPRARSVGEAVAWSASKAAPPTDVRGAAEVYDSPLFGAAPGAGGDAASGGGPCSKTSMLSSMVKGPGEGDGTDGQRIAAPAGKDWTREFQQALRTRGEHRYRRITALIDEFTSSARAIAIRLIDERDLPDEQKTYKQLHLGIAGGQKYLVEGIFFKFAIDLQQQPIYGDAELAAKAAGHELRGLNALLSTSHQVDVYTPLVALIDYAGFRLMASSQLPIDGVHTLRYGALDRSMVYNSDALLAKKMQHIAHVLHLAKHKVPVTVGGSRHVPLHMPRDIEVHLGLDDRYYVIDTARLFPPEAPRVRYVNGALKWCSPLPESYTHYRRCAVPHLVFQLRPELLKKYGVALSSDAFSHFGQADSEKHNTQVRYATLYLLKSVIPHFALGVANNTVSFVDHRSLVEALHRCGINVRHLGLVRTSRELSGDAHVGVRRLLLEHCVGRTLKQLLFRELRACCSTEQKLRECAAAFLSLVFGASIASEIFWRDTLQPELEMRFNFCVTREEAEGGDTVRALLGPNIVQLFELVQDLTNVRLSHKARKRMLDAYKREFTPCDEHEHFAAIEACDVVSLEPRVKQMALVPRVEADHLAMQARSARQQGDMSTRRSEQVRKYEEAAALYDKASSLYERALGAKPDEDAALRNWANILTDMANLKANIGDMDQAVAIFDLADSKYRVCHELRPDSCRTLSCWGNFLTEFGRAVKDTQPERAGELFDRGLSLLSRHEEMRASRIRNAQAHADGEGVSSPAVAELEASASAVGVSSPGGMSLKESTDRAGGRDTDSNTEVHSSLLYYAHIQEKLGKVAEARNTLKKVTRLMEMQSQRTEEPNVNLQNNLACAYMLHGQVEIKHSGEREQCAAALEKARLVLERIHERHPMVATYNLACVLGLQMGIAAEAERRVECERECRRWVEQLVSLGVPRHYRPPRHEILMDECLAAVRDLEWFRALVRQLDS